LNNINNVQLYDNYAQLAHKYNINIASYINNINKINELLSFHSTPMFYSIKIKMCKRKIIKTIII